MLILGVTTTPYWTISIVKKAIDNKCLNYNGLLHKSVLLDNRVHLKKLV